MNRSIISGGAYRPPILALAAALAVAFIPACEDDGSPSGVGPQKPFGILLHHSDCKTNAESGPAAEAHPNTDCVEWSYSQDGTLALRHVNAGFNCCPFMITADFTITEDEITIVEHEARAQCRCLCLYDIDYKIVQLPAGIYTIRFIEPYLLGDPALSVRVGLSSNPAGSFCVDRTHYPWHTP